MKRFNPGNNAGLLVLVAILLIGLGGSNVMAIDKQVAENPLNNYQGLGKVGATAIDEVICNIGMVDNLISNSTSEYATGTNDWTILIGDDAAVNPSMVWKTPGQYADNNHYLYFASLRIGYQGHNVRLSQDQATNITIRRDGVDDDALSLFDTQFYVDDQSPLVPNEYKVGVGVWQNTYAWSESYRDDFIIYDWYIKNLNEGPLDSIFVALHADADISTAEGGTGTQAWSRDDLPGYYRDDDANEYISYMYDGDNPTIPGNDIGGRQSPKECAGYLGSLLMYCPARMGETEETIQSGHGWWDWNSDPSDDDAQAEWYDRASNGLWLEPPPSPHDFRYLQKFGPFTIPGMDSIRVMVAYGLGEGLEGLRTNLGWANTLFTNDWVGPSAPQAPVYTVTPGNGQVTIEWDSEAETSHDPLTFEEDFEGYRVWKQTEAGWSLLMECDLIDDIGFNTGIVHSYVDYDVHNYFQYTYAVTAYDKGDFANNVESLESGKGAGLSAEPGTYDMTAGEENSGIHVVPNPFVAQSAPDYGFSPTQDNPATERIVFVNLPPDATIRVYTLTGDLITTLENITDDNGDQTTAGWDLITDNMQTIVSGLYLYVVEASGEDDFVGKFAVIR
ncbi:MAG: hypothetical protein GY839_17285 [candidate division Zixibacteria bacterium]|nr:hypothetical protein [candidate division Zixibacteria bacterium]